ncbi:2-octaprenyl-3-methyl-6-methoxy-1,4-benzoquinol hydroxylase [Maricurvus nonylphenolicus]|uniref:FAD-dependent monooxygenase n=1 Tax=Maricurvus nonylphenolicus TaxID=1008307 RepID=UPI0036F392E4
MNDATEMTESRAEFDILIVGAGLVGGALACALAQIDQSLAVGVIEAGPDPKPFNAEQFDPRVVALTHASKQLLASIGAWDMIEAERTCPYTDMHVWDADGTGNIHFDCREVQQPSLGHIVENSVAVRAITQQLYQRANVQLIHGRVETLHRDDQAQLSQVILESGEVVSAPLLLACDGANSKVRELANMHTREWDYGHHAVVTTVRSEQPHQFTAWQRFLTSGPLAFLPLVTAEGDAHQCSIVWSVLPELAEALMALDDDTFCLRLSDAFEHKLGKVVHADKRFSFPLRQRHAIDYIKPGIALVGDACHTIHPLAGQGVNLGFLDVLALQQEIQRACERNLPLSDESILRRYQRQRKSGNLSMMAAMEGFKRLFGADNIGVRWVRNEGLRQVNSLPLLKNTIVKQAMGL